NGGLDRGPPFLFVVARTLSPRAELSAPQYQCPERPARPPQPEGLPRQSRHYSQRSASAGSMRAALRAGISAASPATAKSAKAAEPNTNGSRAETPNNCDAIRAPAASA